MAIAAALTLSGAAIAEATFQPTIYYKPPLIRVLDHSDHLSQEFIVIRRAGAKFTFENEALSPFAMEPGSDPGCEFAAVATCPIKGVERMVVLLGPMNDSLDISLGRSARKVRQAGYGGEDMDELTGGRGRQKLAGGDDADTLRGGPGRDLLIGGPGTDTCRGGPGRDVIRSCE